jgi:3-dehydroquinate synthase
VVADENTEILADEVLATLKRANMKASMVIVQAGEETKSLHWAAELYDELAEMNADRRTLIVPVGGGVIGDLAGFVAATYNRGLPLFMVPTTLLAMVDSSVGGKVGINHPRGKNLIGAFHQPVGVWIDTAMLTSLPEREYCSGLAEVVKYGAILDPEFFEYLEQHTSAILTREAEVVQYLVARSCQLKARIVEQDEREETGLRAVLNYGHTFAHAFETVGGYGFWLHGEAVAAGMVCAARLAVQLGRIPETIAKRTTQLLAALNLPTQVNENWPHDELLEVMRRDKKSVAGALRFVLPTALGRGELIDQVPEAAVRQAMM